MSAAGDFPETRSSDAAPFRRALLGQVSLDRGITEGQRSAPFAGGLRIPAHLRIEPTGQ